MCSTLGLSGSSGSTLLGLSGMVHDSIYTKQVIVCPGVCAARSGRWSADQCRPLAACPALQAWYLSMASDCLRIFDRGSIVTAARSPAGAPPPPLLLGSGPTPPPTR